MKRIFYFCAAAVAFFMVEEQARMTILTFRDPIVMTHGSAQEYQVKRGGTLNLIYEYDHIRFCETTFLRFIVRKLNNTIVYRDTVPGGASGLGHQRNITPFKLPSELDPNVYIFRMFPSSQCREGAHQVDSPEVEFEIVE